MNRQLIFFISFVLCSHGQQFYLNDKLVRLEPQTIEHIHYLQNLQLNTALDFWTDTLLPNKSVDIHIQANEYDQYVAQFQQTGLSFRVLVDNLQKIIDDEQQRMEEDHSIRLMQSRLAGKLKADIVGTYASYGDMMDYLQEKVNANPNSMQIVNLGQTYEGRDLKGIVLQFNPSSTRNIWIDCGIHAREWITPATCIWMVDTFIKEYQNNDPTTRNLLNFWNVYIVPSLNPDGYEFSRTNGNRLWRKSRNINAGSSCIGVDLNRNYPWQWMTGGASSSPCSDLYAGQSAASELETDNVVNFLQSKIGSWDMYMSFHSYGQWWFTPYGYTTSLPMDYSKQYSLARLGADAIEAVNKRKYDVGSVAQLLYIASGSTVDWAYDVLKIRFTYTIELPPSQDEASTGFILPPDQAPGVCDETYIGMKVFLDGVKKEVETTLNG